VIAELNPEGALRVNARAASRPMRSRRAPQPARIALVTIFSMLSTKQ
jgi:hypothetical protein